MCGCNIYVLWSWQKLIKWKKSLRLIKMKNPCPHSRDCWTNWAWLTVSGTKWWQHVRTMCMCAPWSCSSNIWKNKWKKDWFIKKKRDITTMAHCNLPWRSWMRPDMETKSPLRLNQPRLNTNPNKIHWYLPMNRELISPK